MLEDRPVLRERVLAAGAISAVLIGGAMAMDTILTSGWQLGVASASAATEPSYYQDDTNQQWTPNASNVPVSQPVAVADASYVNTSATSDDVIQNAQSLDGATAHVSLTSYQPNQPPPADPPQPAPVSDDASKARFDQIEADIQQAQVLDVVASESRGKN